MKSSSRTERMCDMNNPMFSIIVPAHNAENHIMPLMTSIAKQSFRDFELIVVCDNCTDATERIAREHGAITDNVHFGRDGLTRDRGIELAKGEWILFADDDDWFLHEYCLQQLADYINQQCPPDVSMVAFGYVFRTKGYITPTHRNVFTPRVAHVWSSCWRRSAIGTARFGDAIFCSDTYFLRDMKEHVKDNYMLWDMPLYYYNFMRKGSQTDLFVKGIIKQSPVAE